MSDISGNLIVFTFPYSSVEITAQYKHTQTGSGPTKHEKNCLPVEFSQGYVYGSDHYSSLT